MDGCRLDVSIRRGSLHMDGPLTRLSVRSWVASMVGSGAYIAASPLSFAQKLVQVRLPHSHSRRLEHRLMGSLLPVGTNGRAGHHRRCTHRFGRSQLDPQRGGQVGRGPQARGARVRHVRLEEELAAGPAPPPAAGGGAACPGQQGMNAFSRRSCHCRETLAPSRPRFPFSLSLSTYPNSCNNASFVLRL